MDTVAELYSQLAPFVGDSGTCEDDHEKILKWINDARRLVYDKGDWPGTVEYACYCATGCCFTLSNRHKRIKAAWQCRTPIDLQGEWYQISTGLATCCGSPCNPTMIDIGGYHVVARNYTVAPYYLRMEGENALDAGTVITFVARNGSGPRTTESLIVGAPFVDVQSLNIYTEVISVVKPRTKGRIRLTAVDSVTPANTLLMAVYEAEDINPTFRKYKVPVCKNSQIIIHAKKKYVPLVNDAELVEFDIETLIFLFKARNAIRNNNNAEFGDNLRIAVAQLSSQMKDERQLAGSPIRFTNPFMVPSLIE